MKATKITYLLVVALALTMVGTGCRKRPVGTTPINNRTTVVRPGDMQDLPPLDPYGGGATSSELVPPMDPNGPFGNGNYTEDRTALAAHVVHFDFDSSVVKSGESGNVSAVASFLQSNPGLGVRVDGHCDERGTDGYNDVLGERRASALRESLISLGVNPNYVITQSLGESKPADPGHNESAWAQNRRGEFVVLHPK